MITEMIKNWNYIKKYIDLWLNELEGQLNNAVKWTRMSLFVLFFCHVIYFNEIYQNSLGL